MKVLVLGSGGREHAIAWKIAQSPRCEKVFLHPGNAGTLASGLESLGSVSALSETIERAKQEGIGLVVIGPEVLLDQGYATHFRKAGFLVVGPDSEGAKLETSKAFSKEFMMRSGVPTAPFKVVHSKSELLNQKIDSWPTVLKLDGLAAGKGVVIAESSKDVSDFAIRIWEKYEFGSGPHSVVVESFLKGVEVSYIGFCDGKHFLPLATATDYKRVRDGQVGPNTGGMGVVSPSPYFNSALEEKIQIKIIQPILREMEKFGMDYRGILYIGLMVNEKAEPFVLEFNARFGDPETQGTLLRLRSDFVTLLEMTARQELGLCPQIEWDERPSVYVVLCAEGYPIKVRTGDEILGLNQIPPSVQVFFSGVKELNGKLVTGGGRVLGMGALAVSAEKAREEVYSAIKKLAWPGMHFRRDIGL